MSALSRIFRTSRSGAEAVRICSMVPFPGLSACRGAAMTPRMMTTTGIQRKSFSLLNVLKGELPVAKMNTSQVGTLGLFNTGINGIRERSQGLQRLPRAGAERYGLNHMLSSVSKRSFSSSTCLKSPFRRKPPGIYSIIWNSIPDMVKLFAAFTLIGTIIIFITMPILLFIGPLILFVAYWIGKRRALARRALFDERWKLLMKSKMKYTPVLDLVEDQVRILRKSLRRIKVALNNNESNLASALNYKSTDAFDNASFANRITLSDPSGLDQDYQLSTFGIELQMVVLKTQLLIGEEAVADVNIVFNDVVDAIRSDGCNMFIEIEPYGFQKGKYILDTEYYDEGAEEDNEDSSSDTDDSWRPDEDVVITVKPKNTRTM